MTEHPQLKELIDSINKRYETKKMSFQFSTGQNALLVVSKDSVIVNSDNPLLVRTLGLIMEKILRGDANEFLDKLAK
jgi:hypothetical protein